MDNPKSLFNNNTKVCENCKRPLPYDYKENLYDEPFYEHNFGD